MTSFLDQTLTAVLDRAAAHQPVPGGGSAAALTVAPAGGLTADGDLNLRGDAITAALLAEAAALSAASLVRINIAADAPGAGLSPRAAHAASQARAVFVNWVGAKGELVFWGGSHVVDPGGRRVAEAPSYTRERVTADVGLADVARRRREMPLLENPRLDLLLQELGRLTTNREEAGVQGSPPRLGS